MDVISSLDPKMPEAHAISAVPVIPAAFFGMVLGLGGLANAWRAAEGLWHVPPWPGQMIGLFGILVWGLLLIGYVLKWILFRPKALQELEHPVQCCFVGLIGVSTMLVGGLVLSYSPLAARLLFWCGKR
jgi:tellurite resistance protein